MARERGREDLPHSIEDVLDGDGAELAARYPSVVLGLINADSERLREKCARSPLSLDEYNRLRAGLAIHKLIVGRSGQPASPSRKGGRRHGGTRESAQDHQETALERIARELEEEERETSSHEHERADVASDAAASERVPARNRGVRDPSNTTGGERPTPSSSDADRGDPDG